MRIITTMDYMADQLLSQLLGVSFLAPNDSCGCIYRREKEKNGPRVIGTITNRLRKKK